MSVIKEFLLLVTLTLLSDVSHALFYDECRNALGMEAGRIPDSAISASSSYEAKSVGPQNARIRQEKNGGAWCPKAQISSEIREYLEVDLVRENLITRTETQGRFGNGQGQEYAEAFLVEFWRSSLNRWVVYKDASRRQILKGNSNTYLVVGQELELPFVASRVRFIPYSEHPRTVCMRVEIYGCPWEQNVLSYSAVPGEAKAFEGKLEDLSYDGALEGGVMKGGLGQLTDGLFGDDIFDPSDKSPAGTRWVGWLNETLMGEHLEITFEFDSPREFSFAHIYVNNMFTRSVQVFSSAMIYFSLDGIRYQPTPIKMNTVPDLSREASRNVSIPLQSRVGRFIRFQFTFAAHWILISEISFESVPILGNMTEENLEQYFLQQDSVVETASKIPGGETTNARKEITPGKRPTSNAQAYIGLITGILAVVVLLLACVILLVVRRGRKKVALLHKHTALVSSSTKPGVTLNMKDLKMNVALSTPIINNGLTRSRLASKTKTVGKNGTVKGKGEAYGNGLAGEESDSENSSVYHEPYKLLPSTKQEYGCLLKKDALSSSKSGEYTDFTSVNSFQEEIKFSSSFYNLAPPPPPLSRPPPYEVASFQTPTKGPQPSAPQASENYYAATDIVKTERREQHLTLGKLTPIRIPEGSAPETSKIPEFPRHRLRVVEKLGEGSFGMREYWEYFVVHGVLSSSVVTVAVNLLRKAASPTKLIWKELNNALELTTDSYCVILSVMRKKLMGHPNTTNTESSVFAANKVHLCEAEGVLDRNGTSSYHKKQLVIVKSLRRGVTESAKNDFVRESDWLGSFTDSNLSKVVGICSQEEPYCILQEYSELGELPQFLRLQTGTPGEENIVSYGCLIYIATQIASGMKYLESLELVHRDLSARNCLIGKQYSVKVSDHAIFCSRYENDYYVADTKARLPIRWMAWESLLLGKQTSKSDVWSFAITLWEILTYCSQQPFAELTNEQVVENSNHWYQNDGLARYLPRPPPCPREIYDLMGECWKRQAADRPLFTEIHLFLQRKNLGYVPATG